MPRKRKNTPLDKVREGLEDIKAGRVTEIHSAHDIFQTDNAPDLNWSHFDTATNLAGHAPDCRVLYDDLADILMVLLVPVERQTFVYYTPHGIGLLLDEETNEVVGVQLEAFKHSAASQDD